MKVMMLTEATKWFDCKNFCYCTSFLEAEVVEDPSEEVEAVDTLVVEVPLLAVVGEVEAWNRSSVEAVVVDQTLSRVKYVVDH